LLTNFVRQEEIILPESSYFKTPTGDDETFLKKYIRSAVVMCGVAQGLYKVVRATARKREDG
jgi:hypothetical protein